jgi:hypothetical protein
MRRFVLLLFAVALFLGTSANGGECITYVVEPILVAQPVYAGMTFHVYRPATLPQGWFLTYDGYAVTQAPGGVWFYGSSAGNGHIIRTDFVVGAVVPTAVALVPHVSIQSTPAQQPVTVVQQGMMSPSWSNNGNFQMVARWRGFVDRMAVLDKPRVPLAWKGDEPTVVFAWTGQSWYQMKARKGETAPQVLQRHLYSLTRMVKTNQYSWNDRETPLLANQSVLWGFLWMGHVAPINF